MGNNNSIGIKYTVNTFGDSTYSNYKDTICTLTGNIKTVWEKISSLWKRGKIWIKISGTWRRGVIWVNKSGTWKRCH